MIRLDVFVDPSCPWAWQTSRWVREVAPRRDLVVIWRSFATEIRDNYGPAPGVPDEFQKMVLEAHALGHQMLRIFEAARTAAGEVRVDELYTQWGRRFFAPDFTGDSTILAESLRACGLDDELLGAADDASWDIPITESMESAYRFGGPKTQTPVIVVDDNPPHGFKGPVMFPAPTGDAALRLWDALQVISSESGFFEVTRPRTSPPLPARRCSTSRHWARGLGRPLTH